MFDRRSLIAAVADPDCSALRTFPGVVPFNLGVTLSDATLLVGDGVLRRPTQ
jgi:hypothetical protein